MINAACYAKINIFLRINGKRPDRYHDLQTLFTQVDLHDTITIEQAEKTELICNDPTLPTDSKNLIIKVRNILHNDYGFKNEYRITLKKNIPAGAGLGGGSSDAAYFLRSVNELSELKLTYDEMALILGSIGSDTVYFLHDKPAYAEGRGEVIVGEAKLPSAPVLLVNPNIHIPTGEIFADGNLKLTERVDLSRMPHTPSYDELLSMLENGMEQAVFVRHPLLKELKSEMMNYGADGALMSGSGSTVFCICRTDEMLERVYNGIKSKYSNFWIYKSRIKGAG